MRRIKGEERKEDEKMKREECKVKGKEREGDEGPGRVRTRGR